MLPSNSQSLQYLKDLRVDTTHSIQVTVDIDGQTIISSIHDAPICEITSHNPQSPKEKARPESNRNINTCITSTFKENVQFDKMNTHTNTQILHWLLLTIDSAHRLKVMVIGNGFSALSQIGKIDSLSLKKAGSSTTGQLWPLTRKSTITMPSVTASLMTTSSIIAKM